MALTARRHRVGGTSADVTQSVGENNEAIFEPGVALWVWQLSAGGSRLTDLALDELGEDPVTEVTSTTDPVGQVPAFYTPVGVTEVWVAAAEDTTGPRVLLSASDLAEDIATLDAAIDAIEVEAGVTSVQGKTGVIADLAPEDLVPTGAVQSDVEELQERTYTTTVVQVGAGYPARPSYADYVHWVGTLDPAASAVDGDEWHYPDVA